MKKSSFAFAVSLAVASVATTPVPAVTFGALATIYVASGVYDDGSGENAGHATTVTCTNVSGFLVHLRIVILGPAGNVEGSTISFPVGHGTTVAVSTHGTLSFNETNLLTGPVVHGALNVESTQSAVFCSAMVVAAGSPSSGVALHMVRIHADPGTTE